MRKSFVGVQEGTDKKIATYEFIEGTDTKHVERISIGAGILELPSTPQISGVSTAGEYPTTPIDVTANGYVVIKSRFTDSGVSVNVKLIIYDVNDNIIGYSESQTINATDLQESSEYIGDILIFENRIGVSKVKIKLEDNLSSGTVSFWIAGV